MEDASDTRQWFLRMKGDDKNYGPVDTPRLVVWAEQARILPGHEVSCEPDVWLLAETVPELEMTTYIDLGEGKLAGPFNRKAAELLIERGRVPATAKLVEETPSEEEAVEEEPLHEEVPEEADDGNSELQAELDALNTALEDVKDELAEVKAALKEKEEELRELRLENEELKANLEAAVDESKRLETEAETAASRLAGSESAYQELLKTSTIREADLRKKVEELEKTSAMSPADVLKFQGDQRAVYQLVKEEADMLARQLEDDQSNMEKLRAEHAERQRKMLDRRHELLQMLGSSPAEMTARILRESGFDAQIAALRAQVENQHITTEREKQYALAREDELLQKIRRLESQMEHLKNEALIAERSAGDTQALREAVAEKERELNDERRSRIEDQEQFAATKNALLARIDTLENRIGSL